MTRWLCAVVVLVSLASTHAQEGYPLVGTWYGDWGPSKQERHDVTLEAKVDVVRPTQR